MTPDPASGPGPIGRQSELIEISDFLARNPDAPCAVVITGDAGIGKTVVWNHVVRVARCSGRVLSCRPAATETRLAFSALDDLFSDVIGEILPALPEARRRALEVTLLRGLRRRPAGRKPEAGEQRPPMPERWVPDQRVLARGMLDVLRILARDGRLVLAVDDAQWLDGPSAAVLGFCLRRLEHEPVAMVMTLGTGPTRTEAVPLAMDRDLPPSRLARVELGPLSPNAVTDILRSRLNVSFPRPLLRRLHDTAGGNPLYALECARALLARGDTCPAHEPIPVPDSLVALVRPRLRGLAADSLRVGRLLATSPDTREDVIRAAHGDQKSWLAVDQAVDDGIVERDDGGGLRFTHPLLGPVLYAGMNLAERRDVHRRLARFAREAEERAWHLALAADGPDEAAARVLDEAARLAVGRGAPDVAAVLAEQAVRLTPGDRTGSRRDRMADAADHHFRSGELTRSRELIESALAASPPRGEAPAGRARGWLLLRLATIQYHQSGWTLAEKMFNQVAREAPDDPALRAQAEQEVAMARLVAGDLSGASRWARASLRSAGRTGRPRLMAHSLARLAVFEVLLGHHARAGLLRRAETLYAYGPEEPAERLMLFDPPLARAAVLKWSDRLDEARRRLAACYRRAVDRGDEASLPFLLYHFSELECWAGKWTAAHAYAQEGCKAASENQQQAMLAGPLYALALVEAHLGQAGQAREHAVEALTLAKRTGNVPIATCALSVLGFIELSLDDHQAAHGYLEPLAAAVAEQGLGEPGVVRFLPDEIEVLAALGEVDLARSHVQRLQAEGKARGRPWALATAARCRALLASADGDYEGAQTACKEALDEHDLLPMPFELGRTLLVKGMVERRAKYKSAATESLSKALDVFEELGAPLWAEKARRELSRISARSISDALTGTERRVAGLIAQGQTNREIAATMFVTQNTVQTHIRHIFLKLGVRSRTELTARLLTGPGRDVADSDSTAARRHSK